MIQQAWQTAFAFIAKEKNFKFFSFLLFCFSASVKAKIPLSLFIGFEDNFAFRYEHKPYAVPKNTLLSYGVEHVVYFVEQDFPFFLDSLVDDPIFDISLYYRVKEENLLEARQLLSQIKVPSGTTALSVLPGSLITEGKISSRNRVNIVLDDPTHWPEADRKFVVSSAPKRKGDYVFNGADKVSQMMRVASPEHLPHIQNVYLDLFYDRNRFTAFRGWLQKIGQHDGHFLPYDLGKNRNIDSAFLLAGMDIFQRHFPMKGKKWEEDQDSSSVYRGPVTVPVVNRWDGCNPEFENR